MLARRSGCGKRIGGGAAVLLGAVLLCAPAAAQQNNCPPSRAPITLNFNTTASPPSYNRSVPLAGVGNLARANGMPSGDRSQPVGLTRANMLFGLKGASTLLSRGAGFCVYLTSVDVDFGWDRMDVYVPSEYPPGSCEYRAVIDHENQHVAIYRAALREFAPRARARVEAVLAKTRPFPVAGRNGGMSEALAPVRGELDRLLREFMTVHATRHQQIDSPSNYAAVTAMCKNWGGPPSR